MSDSPQTRRRGPILFRLGAVVFVALVAWGGWEIVFDAPSGDRQVRAGDHNMASGDYEQALAQFDRALELNPESRGALLGKAAALIQLHRYNSAEQVLNYVITVLSAHAGPGDAAGLGALAAAYGNRGILHDREARYDQALSDYVESLKIDADAVTGPGVVDRVLFAGGKPSGIRSRAEFLYKQLQLPEGQRHLGPPPGEPMLQASKH